MDSTEIKTKTAPEFLKAARQHMEDRAKTYDKPQGERSMEATVKAFFAVTGVEMTTEQGWLFMAILKMVRSQQGHLKLDNYEDGAAYMALAGETASFDRLKSENPVQYESALKNFLVDLPKELLQDMGLTKIRKPYSTDFTVVPTHSLGAQDNLKSHPQDEIKQP